MYRRSRPCSTTDENVVDRGRLPAYSSSAKSYTLNPQLPTLNPQTLESQPQKVANRHVHLGHGVRGHAAEVSEVIAVAFQLARNRIRPNRNTSAAVPRTGSKAPILAGVDLACVASCFSHVKFKVLV